MSSTAAVDVATTGLPGDILMVSDAENFRTLAAIHPLVDLRSFIDEATLLGDFGPHLVSLVANRRRWRVAQRVRCHRRRALSREFQGVGVDE